MILRTGIVGGREFFLWEMLMPGGLKIKSKHGVTLLEIIITIGIFTIVAALLSMIFSRFLFVYRTLTDKNIAAEQAQTAMEWIVRDIHAGAVLLKAEASDINIVSLDNDNVRYYLDVGANQIKCINCSGTPNLLAEGITLFTLRYYGINNNEIADPVADITDLRMVEIDITATAGTQEFRLNTVARFRYNPDHLWFKTYGAGSDTEDKAESICETPGGYLIAGSTYGGIGLIDILLIKTDEAGNAEWAKTYGTSEIEGLGVDYVRNAYDGGYIIASNTNPVEVNSTILLIKTDAAGTKEWAKEYYTNEQLEFLKGFHQMPDGGYILVGKTLNTAFPNGDTLIIKTNAAGVVEWATAWGGNDGGDELLRVLPVPSGGGVAVGYTTSFSSSPSNVLFLRINKFGKVVSAKYYNKNSGTDYIYSLRHAPQGFIMAGIAGVSSLSEKVIVMKTDVQGDIGGTGTWAKTYSATRTSGFGVQPTNGGGYIINGYYGYSTVMNDGCLLIKTNATGAVEWSKRYRGSMNAGLNDPGDGFNIIQTISGGYLTATYTSEGGDNFLVLKTDAQGELGCCNVAGDEVVINTTLAVQDINMGTVIDITNDPKVVETDITPGSGGSVEIIEDDVTTEIQVHTISLDDLDTNMVCPKT
ncbi:MAG: prepilin-type N-terminal cleavage/methylation domain-containing protein [Candidatus Omnitrophota bacterium]